MMYLANDAEKDVVSGYTIAMTFTMMNVLASVQGLIVAVGVLTSIAFGQQDYPECEKVLQRGRILCLFAFLPILIVQLCCYQILIMVGVETKVAEYAHYNGLYLCLAMLFQTQFLCYN